MKKILGLAIALVFALFGAGAVMYLSISADLPKLITVADYEPLLVSEVYARGGEKIGEFFNQKRRLVAYVEIPEVIIKAFVAAEDSSFFSHGGINYISIFRAFMANLRAGKKVQGGSTITQQVARSLLLSPEKTYTRKIREILLAQQMEANLSKQEILYLYLNQIYLGEGAYGITLAAQIYFHKTLKELTLAEIAILAGLPQAPSRYSPVSNPAKAKERQRYVLNRMVEDKIISEEQAKEALSQPIKVFISQDYKKIAPYYLEAVRALLIQELGEDAVLNKGLKIQTGLDYKRQIAAKSSVEEGLRLLDHRQGFRGPLAQITNLEEKKAFLLEVRNEVMDRKLAFRLIQPDGKLKARPALDLSRLTKAKNLKAMNPNPVKGDSKDRAGGPPQRLENLPRYLHVGDILKGVVVNVNDGLKFVTVHFAETKGIIDFDSMKWARKPNPQVRFDFDLLQRPSQALKSGDVILVRVKSENVEAPELIKRLQAAAKSYKDPKLLPDEISSMNSYVGIELEQEPQVEGALLSFDQRSEEIIAMVGGFDFKRSEFNRTFQAARQTGSSFKAIVYAAALDHGYTPVTPLIDAPIVYEQAENPEEAGDEDAIKTRWKPANHSMKFSGEVLFRQALVRSMNVPTVKIIEDIGVDWVAQYARRMGIFSALNMDFTLALGSSSITLYEMTKMFSQFGRLGRRIRPLLIHSVTDRTGKALLSNLSMDKRFASELGPLELDWENRRQAFLKDHQEKLAKDLADPTSETNATGSNGENVSGSEKKKTYKPKLFFDDPDQLIEPTTAYLITHLLMGVINDPLGTGAAARALGRPVAGKTGTTNSYNDAWFLGYTQQIVTGTWVGYDEKQTMGKGEVGGRAALPIWLYYMKNAHENEPVQSFSVPTNIVFANVDSENGKLASSRSRGVINQAFLEGTEPTLSDTKNQRQEETDFLKEDLTE